MKIAITGKGGVGKTTLSSLLAHLYAEEGKKVIAVDADPDANLLVCSGLPPLRHLGASQIGFYPRNLHANEYKRQKYHTRYR